MFVQPFPYNFKKIASSVQWNYGSRSRRANLAAASMARAHVQVNVRLGTVEDAEVLHPMIHTAYRTDASWTSEVELVKGERISLSRLQEQLQDGMDPIFVATMIPTDQVAAPDTCLWTYVWIHTTYTAGHVRFTPQGCHHAQVIGCICAEWAKNHSEMELSDDCCMFGLFAVDPGFQSQGVGSKLMRHAMQHAKSAWGCKHAVLWVIKQRPEILAWYERWGFEWRGERKDFVFPDLKMFDDVEFKVLHKDL